MKRQNFCFFAENTEGTIQNTLYIDFFHYYFISYTVDAV